MDYEKLIDILEREHDLSEEQWRAVIGAQKFTGSVSGSQVSTLRDWAEVDTETDSETDIVDNTYSVVKYANDKARNIARKVFGNRIYIRGLIEISNYCRNNCYYCGIRRDNKALVRYRLTKEDIMECAKQGYGLGYRTFVLQGGEDGYYSDEVMCDIISSIKKAYPDCAVTLSLGERSRESYKRMYEAGADRYLLRHETGDKDHYQTLHPDEMSYDNRIECLWTLKEIGYQVGCGFMVGSPGQSVDHLVKDMKFIKKLEPQMVGIGPFVPHHETPFANETQGTYEQTLYMMSLIRIMLPEVLLPATTALGTINPRGREMGILAGGNVLMPNLSPVSVRKLYELYDNKICTGDESAECRNCLNSRVQRIGYEIVTDRGDAPSFVR